MVIIDATVFIDKRLSDWMKPICDSGDLVLTLVQRMQAGHSWGNGRHAVPEQITPDSEAMCRVRVCGSVTIGESSLSARSP